jgi:hypothetical protein
MTGADTPGGTEKDGGVFQMEVAARPDRCCPAGLPLSRERITGARPDDAATTGKLHSGGEELRLSTAHAAVGMARYHKTTAQQTGRFTISGGDGGYQKNLPFLTLAQSHL